MKFLQETLQEEEFNLYTTISYQSLIDGDSVYISLKFPFAEDEIKSVLKRFKYADPCSFSIRSYSVLSYFSEIVDYLFDKLVESKIITKTDVGFGFDDIVRIQQINSLIILIKDILGEKRDIESIISIIDFSFEFLKICNVVKYKKVGDIETKLKVSEIFDGLEIPEDIAMKFNEKIEKLYQKKNKIGLKR